MIEVVIHDGLQNGSWVTNHQETKPFSKKRRVISEKIFLRSKARSKNQGTDKETTSGRTPVTWSAVNWYPQSADVTRVVFAPLARTLGAEESLIR